LLSELQKRVSNIAKIENNSFLKLGNKSLISDIEAAQEELESTLSTWLLCIQARAACWQVLSAYPGEIHLKVLRQNDIKDSISQVLHTDGLTREIRVALLDAIGKIDGVLNKAELAKRREIFGEQILNCLDNFSIKAIEVQNKVDEVGATLLSYEKQPLQIIIRMKNDEVFEIMEIS
jgi:hypothetical protein